MELVKNMDPGNGARGATEKLWPGILKVPERLLNYSSGTVSFMLLGGIRSNDAEHPGASQHVTSGADRVLRTTKRMAGTKLTKIGPIQALKLCFFAVVLPDKLVEAERERFAQQSAGSEHAALKVRRAFWGSLKWVLSACAIGFFAGRLFRAVFGPAAQQVVPTLQLVGATLLLWGTLFVRGWDIQTIGGSTLTERVNRWIYRLMYCFGTAVIVASLVL